MQRGDDGEAAAAPAQRPEQVVVPAHLLELPVGGDHVERAHAVEREPERAAGESHAAAGGDAADPDGRARARGDGGAACCELRVGVDVAGAGPDGRDAVVEPHGAQLTHVDHDGGPAGRGAVVGVPARADGQRDVEAIGPADDGLHVGAIADLHDRGRAHSVVAAIEDQPTGVIAGVAGRQHAAAHRFPERPDLRLRQLVGLRRARADAEQHQPGRRALRELAP